MTKNSGWMKTKSWFNTIGFTLFFIPIISACSEKSNDGRKETIDCQYYRNGVFEIVDEARGMNFLVQRNDSIQIETNRKTGGQMVFRVNWIDTCNYELNLVTGDEISKMMFKDRMLNVKIVNVSELGYEVKSNLTGRKDTLHCTLKFINKEVGELIIRPDSLEHSL